MLRFGQRLGGPPGARATPRRTAVRGLEKTKAPSLMAQIRAFTAFWSAGADVKR